MEGHQNSLEQLSKTVGINLNELRDKYKGIARAEQEKTEVSKKQDNQRDLERLDNYRICKACLGRGTVKTIYNHMVMERDCEECDGEAIIDKRTQDILNQMS